MVGKQKRLQFVVCIKNEGYQASLEVRKLYQAVPDDDAAGHGLIRVLDGSGEDYLYPVDYFAPITLSETLVDTLALVVQARSPLVAKDVSEGTYFVVGEGT